MGGAKERSLEGASEAPLRLLRGLIHEASNQLQASIAVYEFLEHELKGKPEALALLGQGKEAQDALGCLLDRAREYISPLRLERRIQSISEILEEAWSHLAGLRRGRDARLRIEETPVDPRASVDRIALEKALRAILETSLRTCDDPAEIEARWSWTSTDGSGAVSLSLRDSGKDLTAEETLDFFEPFSRIRGRRSSLEIALARRIVEAHGGSIALGKGSPGILEVVVALPQEPAD